VTTRTVSGTVDVGEGVGEGPVGAESQATSARISVTEIRYRMAKSVAQGRHRPPVSGWTTRILPQAEYGRLVGTELERAVYVLPDNHVVLVLERDGVLMGCWAACQYLHVEGLWIAPQARKRTSASVRLWTAMRDLIRSLGWHTVLTAAVTEDVRALVTHVHGVPLPGTHYVIPIAERES
jgi:hypothetical protein